MKSNILKALKEARKLKRDEKRNEQRELELQKIHLAIANYKKKKQNPLMKKVNELKKILNK